jgi:hypothetical protein
MNELQTEVIHEMDLQLELLQERMTVRGLAEQIAYHRPDLVQRLTESFGTEQGAMEAVRAIITEAIDRPKIPEDQWAPTARGL